MRSIRSNGLPDKGEIERLREVPDQGLAGGLLQDQHVAWLNEDVFMRISKCPIEIDADCYLAPSVCRPENGQ